MHDQPAPEPEERDASPERREEEDAMRYPGHEDPDAARSQVGLRDEGEGQDVPPSRELGADD